MQGTASEQLVTAKEPVSLGFGVENQNVPACDLHMLIMSGLGHSSCMPARKFVNLTPPIVLLR